MFNYLTVNQNNNYDEEEVQPRLPDELPIDFRLDEKMRQVEEAERARMEFTKEAYGNSYHEQKSHPGEEPNFVIQTCLFVFLGILLLVIVAVLHVKIYKKRRQQIKEQFNEDDYEARGRERKRFEEERRILKAPKAEVEEDEDEDESSSVKLVEPEPKPPTFKFVQPKPSTSTQLTGVSTEV